MQEIFQKMLKMQINLFSQFYTANGVNDLCSGAYDLVNP